MRLPVRFFRLTSRPLLSALAAAALVGTSACSGTLDVGDPLPAAPPGPVATTPTPAPTTPVIPPPTPADTYAWQWINPSVTGVHFRAVQVLSPSERYFVGDGGTVVHELAGKATVIRQGSRDEALSALWVGSANDIWVGGAKGAGGILVHWDGKRWSESYPLAATKPIDAIQGRPGGGIFLAVGGYGTYMHPSGATSATCTALYGVRDVWVQSANEVWFVGDEGIAKQTMPNEVCVKVDSRPSYGVWGDGTRLLVASVTTTGQTEVVEKAGESFVRLGAPIGGLQAPFSVRRGKTVVADGAGNPVVLLHSDRPVESDSYAVFDSQKGSFRVQDLRAAEAIFGLGAGGRELAMVGVRGLHGTFRDGIPVSTELRNRLSMGLPASDGSIYSNCSNYGVDVSVTRMCQLVDGRWERLPELTGYHSAAAVAGSKDSLWLGGFAFPISGSRTDYYALRWDGATWTRGPEETAYMMRPLYASSANDVWAWSDYKTLHYDGKSWSVRASGGPGTGGFRAADGLGADDVWLVDTASGLSHWDGTSLRHVTSLPAGNHGSELRHSVVADRGGVWMMATISPSEGPYVQFERLIHWNGTKWTLVDLPGVTPRALSRGPDGVIRMVAGGDYVSPVGGTTATSVWTVSDAGVQKELDLPLGVDLLDIFSTKDAVYAIGEGGATLRFAKVAPANGTR